MQIKLCQMEENCTTLSNQWMADFENWFNNLTVRLLRFTADGQCQYDKVADDEETLFLTSSIGETN